MSCPSRSLTVYYYTLSEGWSNLNVAFWRVGHKQDGYWLYDMNEYRSVCIVVIYNMINSILFSLIIFFCVICVSNSTDYEIRKQLVIVQRNYWEIYFLLICFGEYHVSFPLMYVETFLWFKTLWNSCPFWHPLQKNHLITDEGTKSPFWRICSK